MTHDPSIRGMVGYVWVAQTTLFSLSSITNQFMIDEVSGWLSMASNSSEVFDIEWQELSDGNVLIILHR